MLVLAALVATVTFAAPAAPAGRLLPELGRAAGLRLEADARLASEVLVVRAKDVPMSELLRHVAEATGGVWAEHEGRQRLELRRIDDERQRRAEATVRGRRIRRWLAWDARPVPNPPPNLNIREHVATAMFRLAVETLGGLGYRERVVFSTRPTPMQVPMPPDLLDGIGLPWLRPGVAEAALLAIQRVPGAESLSGRLFTVDAEGHVLAQETLRVRERGALKMRMADGRMMLPLDTDEPMGTAVKLPKPDEPVLLDEATKALAARLGRWEAASPVTSIEGNAESSAFCLSPRYTAEELADAADPTVVEAVRSPETREPLGLVLGPALESLAQAEGSNLVALLPDEAFAPSAAFLARRDVRAAAFLEEARLRWGLDATLDGGWLTLRPRSPARTRDLRADRPALGRALRALAARHGLTLAEQVDLAAAEPLGDGDELLEGALLPLVDGGWGRAIAASSATGERTTLRAYRALGSASGDGRRPFASLTPDARASWSDLVYNAVEGPESLRRDQLFAELAARRLPVAEFRAAIDAFRDPPTERTVVWPEGVPRDATLAVEPQIGPVYVGLAPGGARPSLGRGGSSSWLRNGPNGERWAATNSPRLARYVTGTETLVQIDLLTRSFRVRRRIGETLVHDLAKAIPFSDLPKPQRDQIEYAESFLSQGGAMYRDPVPDREP